MDHDNTAVYTGKSKILNFKIGEAELPDDYSENDDYEPDAKHEIVVTPIPEDQEENPYGTNE